DRDICQALTDVELTHKEFDEMLVEFGKDRRILELQNDIERWQTRVRQARATWEKADTLARANSRHVDPILAERITAFEENLRVDESGLKLAKEIVQRKWGMNNPSFHQALGAGYCQLGDVVLFQQENPKLALQYYERTMRIIQGPGEPGKGPKAEEDRILEKARTGREAASFLFQEFTGTL